MFSRFLYALWGCHRRCYYRSFSFSFHTAEEKRGGGGGGIIPKQLPEAIQLKEGGKEEEEKRGEIKVGKEGEEIINFVP